MARTTWKVYELRNESLKELYYGVSKAPQERLTTQHCVGETVALQHWDCGEDKITGKILAEYQTQHDASARAHALERQAPPRGWTIIQTAVGLSEMRCETPQEALGVLAVRIKNIAEDHERRAREARKLEKCATAKEATNE